MSTRDDVMLKDVLFAIHGILVRSRPDAPSANFDNLLDTVELALWEPPCTCFCSGSRTAAQPAALRVR